MFSLIVITHIHILYNSPCIVVTSKLYIFVACKYPFTNTYVQTQGTIQP